MAYTTPTTKSAGNVIGAADWNSHVDDIKWLAEFGATGAPFCQAYRTSTLSIAHNTFTPITWNGEYWDNAGVHSTAVNSSRFTAPVDGVYLVSAFVSWAVNSTGIRIITIAGNGTGVAISGDGRASYAIWPLYQHVHILTRMGAGQYMEILAYQSSGGNLNIEAGATCTFKWLTN